MSKWIEAIEVDADGEELNILYGTDSDGNKYVIVKIADVFKALAKCEPITAIAVEEQ